MAQLPSALGSVWGQVPIDDWLGLIQEASDWPLPFIDLAQYSAATIGPATVRFDFWSALVMHPLAQLRHTSPALALVPLDWLWLGSPCIGSPLVCCNSVQHSLASCHCFYLDPLPVLSHTTIKQQQINMIENNLQAIQCYKIETVFIEI